MRRFSEILRDTSAAAASEMVLVLPFLLAFLFGTVELGNLMMDEHALQKQVRDGARFGARLQLESDYECPDSVFADADATDQIVKVTKDGAVSGAGSPRWTSYWTRACEGANNTVAVSIRCVPKAEIDSDGTGNAGIYTGLDGDIPVVSVAGAVQYRSVAAALGWDTNICLKAESEAPVQGI
jgi:Flp pilus assembly protein TadG